MLSCIFGKCSSEKYVVNKVSRTGVGQEIPGGVIVRTFEPTVDLTTVGNTDHNQNHTHERVTTPEVTQNGHATRVPEEPIQAETIENDIPESSTSDRETQSNKHDDSAVNEIEAQTKSKSKAPPPPSQKTDSKSSSSDNKRSGGENGVTVIVENDEEKVNIRVEEVTETKRGKGKGKAPESPKYETKATEKVEEVTKVKPVKSETKVKEVEEVTKAKPVKSETKVKEKVEEVTKVKPVKSETKVKEEIEEVAEVKPVKDKKVQIEETEPEKDKEKQVVNEKAEANEAEPVLEAAGSSEQKEEDDSQKTARRRSGIVPLPVVYDEDAQIKFKVSPKTENEESLIRRAIEENDFLNKIIVKKRLEDVVKAMYKKEVGAKEIVVKQGDKGSHMYISEKGKFQVLIKNKMVSEFNDVRVFGELAILYNAKRLATIKAVTPGKVWVLDRNVFQQIIVGYYIKEQDEILQFLLNNEVLKEAGKPALREVANLLKSEFFKSGTQIVRQGDKGHKFYIIRAGTVTITKDGEGVVGHCKKGDCFGELALLKEDCRQATVTADAPGVECLTLTRKEFIEHFGEVEALSNLTTQEKAKSSFVGGAAEFVDLNLNDLKIIKTLGVGGFGRVELVQHKKKSDLVFALKYLKKIDIVMQHQQEHVYNEKNIQMTCRSPFIVRLYRTYKDNKYIYFLMESCLGGDLWSLLQKQKLRRFEEKDARFIAGCVLEAFEYLHSRGIIYRDLKPENLLIAANGYIKLTDFGFAKKISTRGKTFTFAGTPEYVAPEIVLNRGHDRSVDYWAYGAFIFELLSGRTPFRTDDSSHMKTYNKILNGIDNIQFPSYINIKAKHIIERLCRPVPSERLGMQHGGIQDIKGHKWFLGFDWQKFAKCEMASPFRPKLKSPIDTQYFDQFKKDTDVPPDEDSGWDNQF